MIHVGIAGIGFMGMIHYLSYGKVAGATASAIMSRDPKKRAGDWRGIRGNFGPEGTEMDLGDIAAYETFDQLLADPHIDAVDICLPPGMHCAATVAALEAGKHVFCEKPMALTTDQCERMSAAAQNAGKVLLIGHVLPFFPEYAKAREIIAGGQFGKLRGGHFKRIISDPAWIPDFYDPEKVGGPLLDLHVHDAHLIRMLFGMPQQVCSQGRLRGAVVEYCHTQFAFDDPELVVSAASGVIGQQSRPFTHGFEIQLEKATLVYEFAVIGGEPRLLMPLTVLESVAQGDDRASQPQLTGGDPLDAFEGQLTEVARCFEAGQPSPILDSKLAQDAIVLCHRQTESVKTRKPVDV